MEGRRFVSRHNVHRMAIELFVTPVNYDGIIEVENIIDGTIINFYDAPRFKVKHMYLTANETLGEHGVYMESATRDRDLHVGTGCVLEAYRQEQSDEKPHVPCLWGAGSGIWRCSVTEGETVRLVKYVSMYTERECPAYALHTTIKEEIDPLWRTVWKQNFENTERI